jgi:DNA-binding transcriptional MocR family regulator
VKDLRAVERAIYLELLYRYNDINNGSIGYSVRSGAITLKISKTTVSRALTSLQVHGFIVAEKRGVFHCKDRHASEYRLTAYPSDIATNWNDRQPTKEFLRWPEIQITVPVVKRTGSAMRLRCPSGETVSSKKADNCPSGETVEAIR